MAEAAPSYNNSLEGKLDVAGSYLLQTGDAELRKYGPKLVKAKHVILGENGIAQYKAGEEAINTLDAVVAADRRYGQRAATKIASEAGYNFKPLLDVMEKDAVNLGLSDNLELHEIYEKVVGNEGTELHRLVTEMAPYNEIIGAAKNSADVKLEGAAKKVYDFDIGVRRAKREQMRKVSVPILAASSTLTGGLVAGAASIITLSLFSYGREAIQRTTEAAPKSGRIGKSVAKGLNMIEGQLGKVGFSIPYAVILGAEKTIGMPINWSSVLIYTAGIQGGTVAVKKIGLYSRKLKAVAKTLREGHSGKNFWGAVKEHESRMEAEAQLEKGPDKTKRGWLYEQARHLNMMKFPVGKTKYIDLMGLRIGERLNEKEIIEEAGREFTGESGKKKGYSPAVCNALLGEYLPNAKVSEEELIKARGASRIVMGTTITESSKSARKFGTGEYAFSPSYCEQVAAIRANVLEKEGYDCVTGENGDVMAFHKSASDRKNLKEAVLVHEKDRLFGTSVKYLEDAVRGGGIVQLPKLGKTGIENWDLQDYKVYLSDLLDEEVAAPALLHELNHVGNRLQAFETLVQLGDAITKQQEKAATTSAATAVSKQSGVKAEGMLQ